MAEEDGFDVKLGNDGNGGGSNNNNNNDKNSGDFDVKLTGDGGGDDSGGGSEGQESSASTDDSVAGQLNDKMDKDSSSGDNVDLDALEEEFESDGSSVLDGDEEESDFYDDEDEMTESIVEQFVSEANEGPVTFRDFAEEVRGRMSHLSGTLVEEGAITPEVAIVGVEDVTDESEAEPGVPESGSSTLLEADHPFYDDYARIIDTDELARTEVSYAIEFLVERGHVRTTEIAGGDVYYVEVAEEDVPIQVEM